MSKQLTLSPIGRRISEIVRKKLKRNPNLKLRRGSFGYTIDYKTLRAVPLSDNCVCPIGITALNHKVTKNEYIQDALYSPVMFLFKDTEISDTPTDYLDDFYSGYDAVTRNKENTAQDLISKYDSLGYKDGAILGERLKAKYPISY